ncbi:MAG TPA: DUF2789 domain-containing protein [Methylophilaceae bacterium]|nr:DUF2789 domain-containing protein [Methylophilaceae bacterium]
METPAHSINNLFAQLGLDSDDASIASFIQTHGPLDHKVVLSEASFWTASQAAFLREEITKDADWAEVIDQLNAALHEAS